MEKVRRYIVFLLGLFINSMGVGLITKANLGTSPISAIPYVLSLRFSLSLGEFTNRPKRNTMYRLTISTDHPPQQKKSNFSVPVPLNSEHKKASPDIFSCRG